MGSSQWAVVSGQWAVDSIQKLVLLSEYMKTSELIRLKRKLFSENWKISLSAADELAYLNTKDAISILIEGLKSENNFFRNASALAIRDSNNNLAFNELWNRIIVLGPHEERNINLCYGNGRLQSFPLKNA